MSATTVIAIYFIMWWVVLFAVLPWGIRSQHESGEITPGTDPGAPSAHVIGRKLLLTTLVTSVIFGFFYVAYTQDLIPFDWLAQISTPPRQ